MFKRDVHVCRSHALLILIKMIFFPFALLIECWRLSIFHNFEASLDHSAIQKQGFSPYLVSQKIPTAISKKKTPVGQPLGLGCQQKVQ